MKYKSKWICYSLRYKPDRAGKKQARNSCYDWHAASPACSSIINQSNQLLHNAVVKRKACVRLVNLGRPPMNRTGVGAGVRAVVARSPAPLVEATLSRWLIPAQAARWCDECAGTTKISSLSGLGYAALTGQAKRLSADLLMIYLATNQSQLLFLHLANKLIRWPFNRIDCFISVTPVSLCVRWLGMRLSDECGLIRLMLPVTDGCSCSFLKTQISKPSFKLQGGCYTSSAPGAKKP